MLEDPKLYYINSKRQATSLEANKRRNEEVFMVKELKKRTELLKVDVVKENNMAASLSISSNTGNIDFNFSARNDAKDSDNASKRKIKNSRLVYDDVQEDTLPTKDKKRLMKINLVLLDNAVNAYLTWRNRQLNHLLHVVTLKHINSFIQMS